MTIERIEHQGVVISESTVAGETRDDGVVPAHPNGIRVSRTRWLLLYATPSFRGQDDDQSILWQLRDGSPVGAVVSEGVQATSTNDWDPLGDGRPCVKQHGHPMAFGMPKGALLRGEPAAHANHFVAKWRRVARRFDPLRGEVLQEKRDPALRSAALGGDAGTWPHGRSRDPLYCWDVDPQTFVAGNRRVVLDTVESRLPLRAEAVPVADMCKLLPHQGDTQLAVHRLRVRAIGQPYVSVPMNEAERQASAIYQARLTYDRAYPDAWEWGV